MCWYRKDSNIDAIPKPGLPKNMSCSTEQCILQNILVKMIDTVATIYDQYVEEIVIELLKQYDHFTGRNIT